MISGAAGSCGSPSPSCSSSSSCSGSGSPSPTCTASPSGAPSPWGAGRGAAPSPPPSSGSSQTGPPPCRICSRSQTRPMKARRVRVTTAQPCRMSASMFSVLNTLMGRERMVATEPVKRVL